MVYVATTPNKTKKHMHPAPENCNPPQMFLYIAVRSALRIEARTNGAMVVNRNAKDSAKTLLEAHRGIKMKPRAKAVEILAEFEKHFAPHLP
jgi:hypothetical protein